MVYKKLHKFFYRYFPTKLTKIKGILVFKTKKTPRNLDFHNKNPEKSWLSRKKKRNFLKKPQKKQISSKKKKKVSSSKKLQKKAKPQKKKPLRTSTAVVQLSWNAFLLAVSRWRGCGRSRAQTDATALRGWCTTARCAAATSTRTRRLPWPSPPMSSQRCSKLANPNT